jgi:hypothetical protein
MIAFVDFEASALEESYPMESKRRGWGTVEVGAVRSV